MADFRYECYKVQSDAEIRCIEKAEKGVNECNAFPDASL